MADTRDRHRWPATDGERSLLMALRGCRFAVGSYDKRFVRNVSAEALNPEHPGLTERQRAFLALLGHRYRRQLASRGWPPPAKAITTEMVVANPRLRVSATRIDRIANPGETDAGDHPRDDRPLVHVPCSEP